MSEFMGLVGGTYDAKAGGKDGFVAGGSSLHGCGTPHGPDAVSLAGALAADTSTPKKFEGGLAFMFETNAMLWLTPFALDRGKGMLQEEYQVLSQRGRSCRVSVSAFVPVDELCSHSHHQRADEFVDLFV